MGALIGIVIAGGTVSVVGTASLAGMAVAGTAIALNNGGGRRRATTSNNYPRLGNGMGPRIPGNNNNNNNNNMGGPDECDIIDSAVDRERGQKDDEYKNKRR